MAGDRRPPPSAAERGGTGRAIKVGRPSRSNVSPPAPLAAEYGEGLAARAVAELACLMRGDVGIEGGCSAAAARCRFFSASFSFFLFSLCLARILLRTSSSPRSCGTTSSSSSSSGPYAPRASSSSSSSSERATMALVRRWRDWEREPGAADVRRCLVVALVPCVVTVWLLVAPREYCGRGGAAGPRSSPDSSGPSSDAERPERDCASTSEGAYVEYALPALSPIRPRPPCCVLGAAW